MFKKLLIILTLSLSIINDSYTQYGKSKYKPPLTRILFILDASQSMVGKWERHTKIDVAKTLLIKMVDSLRTVPNVQIALRIYGFQSYVPPQDCDDTKLVVPFGNNNADKIIEAIRNVQPKGTTPIAHSLELAAEDFPDNCDNCRNVIILITDGIEACDGDPCKVSLALQEEGIILKPFVIGIGLDENFKKTFECVGNFYDATNEKRFQEVLGIVISQALNNTTMQVNLLDINGNPTETNVPMIFYDANTNKIKYKFIHTMNAKGNPDTLVLSPMYKYKIKVNTIPPVYSDTFSLVPGKHKIVGIDAPQGYLQIEADPQLHKNLQVIIRKGEGQPTLNVQKANTKERYIVGKYQVEVLTLPRIISDVKILESHTTKIKIPKPGIVSVKLPSPGYGCIYQNTKKDLKWVCNLDENNLSQNFVLQPGTYTIVFRPRNIHQTIMTIRKTFTIQSGYTSYIRLIK
jgi:Ca-activated chloride channel family protein